MSSTNRRHSAPNKGGGVTQETAPKPGATEQGRQKPMRAHTRPRVSCPLTDLRAIAAAPIVITGLVSEAPIDGLLRAV